ncbi:MAG: transposase [Rhodospirillales bacterium]|nr:transposase [Rhodospirillales bacterium]
MATVTVLSGPERRRRWASSEKASIVEESLRPGAVVAAVARRTMYIRTCFIIGGDKRSERKLAVEDCSSCRLP